MKLKALTFQIAAAALLAPVAVSFANTTPKTAPAKPAKPAVTVAAPAAPALRSALTAQTAPVETPAVCAPTKVRVVYAGYAQPAAKTC